LQRVLRRFHPRRITGDRHPVAATGETNPKRLFDPHQMPVMVPQQQRQQHVVVELHRNGLAASARVG